MCVCLARAFKPSPRRVLFIVPGLRDWHWFDFIKGVRWNGSADHAPRRRSRVRA